MKPIKLVANDPEKKKLIVTVAFDHPAFQYYVLWRNSKFIHMWMNFTFLHMIDVG